MKRVTDFGTKDYLSPSEATVYWKLSRRKLFEFLNENARTDYLAFYRGRKLIVREAFDTFLNANPEVKEGLINGRSNKEIHQERCSSSNLT